MECSWFHDPPIDVGLVEPERQWIYHQRERNTFLQKYYYFSPIYCILWNTYMTHTHTQTLFLSISFHVKSLKNKRISVKNLITLILKGKFGFCLHSRSQCEWWESFLTTFFFVAMKEYRRSYQLILIFYISP